MKKQIDLKARYLKLAKIVGAIVLVMGVVYVILLMMSSSKLSDAYQALADAGRPMEAEAIIPAAIDDVDNAALSYEAAVLRLRSEPVGDRNLLNRASELGNQVLEGLATDEERAEWAKIIDNPVLAEAVEALARAESKSGCRYDLDYTQGAALLLPHSSSNRDLSRILCGLALTHAENGDGEKAWEHIATSLRLADALGNEPLLISQLVRVAQFGVSTKAMTRVLELAPPSLEQAMEIDRLLQPFESLEPLVLAFDGERLLLGEWAFGLADGKISEAWGGGNDRREILALSIYGACKALVQLDHAAYLRVMEGHASRAKMPFAADDVDYGDTLFAEVVPKYCILTRMLAPALSRVKVKFVETIARARMARIGLQMARFHEKNGAYPGSLAEVDGTLVLDPFSHEHFLYRAGEAGYRIYSVGSDLADDGGNPGHDNGDVVWTVGTIGEQVE